ncbi:hypothetical protein ALC56_00716 [Trachymyrmex septentrionalis]|uniref:Uncharacterized protein n=1 Tax=Trachymyrmex septentrionalis TaxID=34720 RepID=A0A195FWB9_9HYME|nr:hypothetical protein ALC56_00716 [Trachymyrmex septentrionalis]
MLVAGDIYDVDRSSHRGRGSYAGEPSEAEIELSLMYPSWMGYK